MNMAIDIGGTKITVALVDSDRIIERKKIASSVCVDLSQLVPSIIALCEPWADRATGLGIASTGIILGETVRYQSVIGSQPIPLKTIMEDALGLPTVLLNDAWAAAWGEYTLGQHGDIDTLVYVTVSTGIGGGIVQNRNLLTSKSGFSSHLGHLTVHPQHGEEYLCSCGRKNCVESMASGIAIGNRASQLMGYELSCAEAFELMDEHSLLEDLIENCAQSIAELVANIVTVTGTNIVVLGGSVGLASGFIDRVRRAVSQLPQLYFAELRSPTLGKDSDILGASLKIQEKLDSC